MSNAIEFEGLEEVQKKLAKKLSPEQMKGTIGKACALVEREAKLKAPKGDGTLRNSISSRIVDSFTGEVFTPLEYAPYVEYGTGLFAEEGGRTDVPWVYKDDKGEWHSTSGMKPHPYMRPALDENREEIKRILKEGITKND
jgi:HK97 gp10 family phage protein